MRRKSTLATGIDASANCHNEIIENSIFFWGRGEMEISCRRREYLLLINSVMKSQHFSNYFPA